jgi:hypothetical protein
VIGRLRRATDGLAVLVARHEKALTSPAPCVEVFYLLRIGTEEVEPPEPVALSRGP